tara:strand:+ start:581 stop:1204 length:624 start_codon:yes stop_codon:yes gene_type:complete
MKLALLKILEIILPEFIKSIFKKREKKRLIIDLENHDVFSTLDRVRNEVANLKFYTHGEYDKVKTRMCYDFTKHKSLKCSARMLEIVRTKDIDIMDRDKLKKFILLEQGDMHREYIKSIRIEWDLKGVSPQDVDYVIHLFEKFRYDVIVSFEHRINSIFGSTYNKDNFALMLAVLEMWAMGIDLLPRDMSTTFESLNGKFKDIKYLS